MIEEAYGLQAGDLGRWETKSHDASDDVVQLTKDSAKPDPLRIVSRVSRHQGRCNDTSY